MAAVYTRNQRGLFFHRFVKQGIKPPTTVLTNVLITIQITSKIMKCAFLCIQEELNTKEKAFGHCSIQVVSAGLLHRLNLAFKVGANLCLCRYIMVIYM